MRLIITLIVFQCGTQAHWSGRDTGECKDGVQEAAAEAASRQVQAAGGGRGISQAQPLPRQDCEATLLDVGAGPRLRHSPRACQAASHRHRHRSRPRSQHRQTPHRSTAKGSSGTAKAGTAKASSGTAEAGTAKAGTAAASSAKAPLSSAKAPLSPSRSRFRRRQGRVQGLHQGLEAPAHLRQDKGEARAQAQASRGLPGMPGPSHGAHMRTPWQTRGAPTPRMVNSPFP